MEDCIIISYYVLPPRHKMNRFFFLTAFLKLEGR